MMRSKGLIGISSRGYDNRQSDFFSASVLWFLVPTPFRFLSLFTGVDQVGLLCIKAHLVALVSPTSVYHGMIHPQTQQGDAKLWNRISLETPFKRLFSLSLWL